MQWDFVPVYYWKREDGRQRDQMKQAVRSLKQNIVEGSEERSLSSKLKLYDVARASGGELLEDYEDVLRLEGLPRWNKDDPRLRRLRSFFEPPSGPSLPSCSSILKIIQGNQKDQTEIIVNYLIDLGIRCGYLLDRQINAVEDKHKKEGGYNEKLLKRRLEHRRTL